MKTKIDYKRKRVHIISEVPVQELISILQKCPIGFVVTNKTYLEECIEQTTNKTPDDYLDQECGANDFLKNVGE